jgi:hypothetical protein
MEGKIVSAESKSGLKLAHLTAPSQIPELDDRLVKRRGDQSSTSSSR